MNLNRILQYNLAGKLFNHFLVFLINVMIVQVLGAGGSGNYFNELYLISFFVSVASLGMDFTIVRLVAQEPSLASRLKWMLLLIVLVFGLLIALVLSIFPGFRSEISDQPALAILLFSTGSILLLLFQALLSSVKKFNAQNFILALFNIAFLVWLYINKSRLCSSGKEELMLMYGLLFFLQGTFMFLICPAPAPDKAMRISWRSLIGEGWLLMLSSIVYFAFLRVDNFFVERYCPPDTLGNYVQCGKVGQYFIYFSSIISSTVLPFVRMEGIGDDFKKYKSLIRPYALILLLAVTAIYLLGQWVFPFLFGSSFGEMYALMVILLPGYFCLGLLTLLNVIYIGKGSLRRIFWGDLAGLIMVLMGDILVVPVYGAKGAAIVSSVAYCLVFLFLFSGIKKQFATAPKDISVY